MPEVKEEEVYSALLNFRGKSKVVKIGKAEIISSLTPENTHKLGRPDSILWIEISLRLFRQNLRIKVPIPVEAEKHGIGDAMEDLEDFIKRSKYPIEMPMLVIAQAGYEKREERRTFPVKFIITQVPIRRLKEE